MRHNTITKGLSTLAFGLLAFSATAQNTRQLTLDEAIDLGLKNSKQLKLSSAKINEATASLREAKENRLPEFSISASYLRVSNPNIDLKTGSSSSSGTDTSGSKSGGTPNVNSAAYVLANASIPVFAGFKIQAGIESAKYLAEAAKLDATEDRNAVIQNTVAAYANLYKAQKAVDLVKEDLRQSQQRVTDFANLEQNGLMARNDLLKAQLQESNVELSLLDAENNFKIATINMNLMLGLQEETELVTDASSFHPVEDTKSIGDWEGMALQSRNDAAALMFREKAAVAGIKAAKADYYPSLAITGGYVAADIPNFITITNALNGGVGVKYSPSSLWKTGAKVAQAKARLAEVQANESMLNDNIRIQINQAYQNYLVSVKKIDVYSKAVEQANENYKIVKSKHENSLATTTDLLDADVAQLQAKLNFAFAKADAIVAYNKLLQTAGVLDKK
ncbi:TolC family protein [Chitinophagaceae bacterium MMS25-I14]